MPKKISGGVVHNLPADLKKVLVSDPKALVAWENITPLARNEWICWTTSVKTEGTRKQHLDLNNQGRIRRCKEQNEFFLQKDCRFEVRV